MQTLIEAIASLELNPLEFEPWLDNPSILVNRPQDHRFVWAVPAGASFVPQVHKYAHELKLLAGTGTITHNGRAVPYGPGSTIWINAGDTYGCTFVCTHTVVLRGPSRLPRRNHPLN